VDERRQTPKTRFRQGRRTLVLVLLGVALVAATVDARMAGAGRTLGTSPTPAPRCTIGTVAYNDQTTVVSATGRCFVPRYKGHKTRKLPGKWSFTWIGYDESGVTFGAKNRGVGKGANVKLNPARFYTVKVTFVVTSPRAGVRPKASASKTQTVTLGGVGLVSAPLGNGPGTSPPPIVNGVNPLCPFHDSYVDREYPGAQCGTAEPGSCAFVTAPTMSSDGTIRAGRWLCPGGRCAAPPNVARGPYKWFGYNIFFVTGNFCGDRDLYSVVGLTSISLVNSDGSTCTLHPDGEGVVPVFRLPPGWGGAARVTFTGFAMNWKTRKTWLMEYETAQLTLNGSANGCTSPDWQMESIQ
jgi:hypothetical protein